MEEMYIIFSVILIILLGILGIVVYFLPSIVAYKRKHANRGIILLINFLLGWTFLGWACCLVWAFIDTDGSKASNLTRNIPQCAKYFYAKYTAMRKVYKKNRIFRLYSLAPYSS